MFSRDQLLEIISGRKRGIVAWVVRTGLSCLTPIYRWGVGSRNRRFDRGIANQDRSVIKKATIPVISVGNLTTGGTGKTPLVIWITKLLRQSGRRVVLISRGYGAQAQENAENSIGRNDEALEMEDRLPGVPHLQDPDRFRMSQIAVQEHGSEIIVLDDGFQHRQLHRDLDIALIDATNPFGYDRLLPRGLLREPEASLSRADFVILTRVDLVSNSDRDAIFKRIAKHAPEIPIATTKTEFTHLLQTDGTQQPISSISDQPVFVFCGIGNPENFSSSLREINLQICGQESFPDHHQFTGEDLESLAAKANQAGAGALLCTHKDLVKVGTKRIGSLPVYAIVIDVAFVSGEEEFAQALLQVK